MGQFTIRTLTGAASVVCLTFGLAATAQEVNDAPLEENWAPSEWGPDDKVGAPNRTTPEIVMKAVGLVKQGKTATLGKLYDHDIPLIPWRSYRMTIPGTPTGGPFGSNQLVFHDEFLSTEIGQVGTPVRWAGAYRRAGRPKATSSITVVSLRRPMSAAPAMRSSAWAISASSS